MKHFTPYITEKSYAALSEDASKASTYTFKVKGDFDKAEIAKRISAEYSVDVLDVRTINLPGKRRRFKNIAGKVSPVTKALVTVRPGQRIAAFEVGAAEPEVAA